MMAALYNRVFEEENIPRIQRITHKLDQHGVQMVFYKDFLQRFEPYLRINQTPLVFTSKDDLPRDTDIFFSLGGDGTMLDSVTFVADSGIPLIGFNLGRLGFLAAVHEQEIDDALRALSKGHYTLEERSLLHLDSSIPLFDNIPFALNEFTIHRKDSSSMIKIHTFLNGEFLNTYWADGLIVATPTGSTGYSLSCGGPLIFPQTNSFVITAVAPHNLNIRPLIIPDNNVISFEIEGRADQYLCTLDSRQETVSSDIQLAIKREKFNISLVRPPEHNFLRTIRQKLYWGMDKRN